MLLSVRLAKRKGKPILMMWLAQTVDSMFTLLHRGCPRLPVSHSAYGYFSTHPRACGNGKAAFTKKAG